MAFNSIQFIIFFIIVVGVYYAIPHRFRWMLLLAASYYFYMCWKAEYVLLIIFSTLVDYYCGLAMGRQPDKNGRRKFMVLSLVVNLGVLFAFKYFNLFNDSLRSVLGSVNIFYGVPAFKVLLPVGISFYTFQTLSYSIDVYRGEKEPEKHLGIFALYVAFFPQLVAGPIERSVRLLPQFYQKQVWRYENLTAGGRLMLWGFFKKIVIADRLAAFVNPVYNHPHEYSGLIILLATYAFAFQIYCDFAGYSDIAIGAARILGIDLMTNFDRPYLARNIADFWKRWHISLTTWFRDYVYIPLGGNRCATRQWVRNIVLVFLLSGLWHGANWTFVLWGGLHAFYYLIYRRWLDLKNRYGWNTDTPLAQIGGVFVTFHAVVFSWIFFRANTVSDAFYLAGNLFGGIHPGAFFTYFPVNQCILLLLIAGVIAVKVLFGSEGRLRPQRIGVAGQALYAQVFYAMVINFLLFFYVHAYEPFIYFQF